ncbi:ATP-binding protein [Roseibacterium sp. SDUM158016]|uniref:hybrid sensor histidine kinase/response regulator n=1 Tax=Roseicyclus sediminis TaxID=2980997 RepID=UPI0021D15F5C|nr:ATP-binding protein [Roseibacterium sp. SDUM158016]MCU4655209.1 ATP-binding protein [Roseibacterium sp. SDUM158016]
MSGHAEMLRGAAALFAGRSLQPALLCALGLAAGFASWLAAGATLSFLLAAVSGGCLGAAVLLVGRGMVGERLRLRELHRAIALLRHDPAPCFVTDASGAIRDQNAAAERRFGERRTQPMARAVGAVLPNAAAVVFRHETAMTRREAAHETVVTPRGAVRLVAQRLRGGILWRLEDLAEAHRAGGGIGLPMMVVGHTDTILSMNDAMGELLGGRAGSLQDIFPQMPLVPGRRTRLMAAEAPIEVVPIIVAARDGRREVYVVPGLAEPPAASVAARAFEALPVALLHIGADGQVLASNRQAQVLLGIGPDELGPLSNLVEGLGRPVRDWVADSLAERIPPRSEVVRARRRADECFLQIALSRISDATGPSLLAVLHDATELKTLEQQFVQSQKMQAIGELAGGVAHDFNNLLTAITGHCDLLLLRHDQGDEDYGDLVQINQNANRAAALVGQLLAFSRKQTLEPDIVDLRDTMGDLTHLLNRLVGEKVTLTLGHDPALLPVRVDRRQLDQVIMNLVVNARDAMPDGGEIRVETRMVCLTEPLQRDSAVVPPGRYVTIRVRDRGLGIPPDKLGRIFEPFFTTKEVGKGTGLGLSMAYGIVKQTGGYIFVDSVVGAGTTFTIYIPAHDLPDAGAPVPLKALPAAAPDAAALVRDVTGGGPEAATGGAPGPDTTKTEGLGTVLLVEDEAPVRAFASRALRLRGYTVYEADNAEAALETLRKRGAEIDLFVTDVVMPGMDGPSWVREALRDRPGVKVVFVSGYSEEDIAELSADIPNSVFLPKPFTLYDLTATVARQLH